MKTLSLSLVILLLTGAGPAKVTFPSKDGLPVTADLYLVNDTLPYMILCHQAGYSRGEYQETAAKFSKLGYNCLAIDQRSGDQVNGVLNETAAKAREQKKPTGYLDAEQDILSAIDYAYTKSRKKVLLVGSSYSASLALKIGAENPRVMAVMAFSPGEYFGKALTLKESIKNLGIPAFVTSSKTEAPEVSKLLEGIGKGNIHQFIPSDEGVHGSKTLWKNEASNKEYWTAIVMFMYNMK